MAKTKISEWSSTPANNTDIDSINIAEGCAPSGINDAIRELMAQVKDLYSGTTGDAIGVAGGGTGQTSYTNGQLLIGNTTGNTLTKATLTAGTGVSITNGTGSITIAATGVGDVVGPASSTDNAFTRFDSTTGKLLQNSTGATLSDTGAAVFTGALDVLGNSTAGSNIKLYEDTDNGTNYVAFKAPDTIAANVTWTLPAADGTSAQVLSTNGSGTLSWATASGGSSQWTTSGSDIYYNTGKVGVGTTTPQRTFSIQNGGPAVEIDPAGVSSNPIYFNYNRTTSTYLTPQYWALGHIWAYNGGNEGMRLASSGELLIGKTTVTTSGAVLQVSNGITFPATQVSLADANTLDDYEEGNWTPNQGGGVTVTGTFGSEGKYTKIGRQVCVVGVLTGTTISCGASGILTSNLPFTGIAGYQFSAGGMSDNNAGGLGICTAASTSVYAGSTVSAVATRLWFSVTYFV